MLQSSYRLLQVLDHTINTPVFQRRVKCRIDTPDASLTSLVGQPLERAAEVGTRTVGHEGWYHSAPVSSNCHRSYIPAVFGLAIRAFGIHNSFTGAVTSAQLHFDPLRRHCHSQAPGRARGTNQVWKGGFLCTYPEAVLVLRGPSQT